MPDFPFEGGWQIYPAQFWGELLTEGLIQPWPHSTFAVSQRPCPSDMDTMSMAYVHLAPWCKV